jgi:hypothetical protein
MQQVASIISSGGGGFIVRPFDVMRYSYHCVHCVVGAAAAAAAQAEVI